MEKIVTVETYLQKWKDIVPRLRKLGPKSQGLEGGKVVSGIEMLVKTGVETSVLIQSTNNASELIALLAIAQEIEKVNPQTESEKALLTELVTTADICSKGALAEKTCIELIKRIISKYMQSNYVKGISRMVNYLSYLSEFSYKRKLILGNDYSNITGKEIKLGSISRDSIGEDTPKIWIYADKIIELGKQF